MPGLDALDVVDCAKSVVCDAEEVVLARGIACLEACAAEELSCTSADTDELGLLLEEVEPLDIVGEEPVEADPAHTEAERVVLLPVRLVEEDTAVGVGRRTFGHHASDGRWQGSSLADRQIVLSEPGLGVADRWLQRLASAYNPP